MDEAMAATAQDEIGRVTDQQLDALKEFPDRIELSVDDSPGEMLHKLDLAKRGAANDDVLRGFSAGLEVAVRMFKLTRTGVMQPPATELTMAAIAAAAIAAVGMKT